MKPDSFLDRGMTPVVPPKKNRLEPWEYDKEMYKRRNEVERLVRRLKGFRRIFSRFEKLDVMHLGFINFALIADMPDSANMPQIGLLSYISLEAQIPNQYPLRRIRKIVNEALADMSAHFNPIYSQTGRLSVSPGGCRSPY